MQHARQLARRRRSGHRKKLVERYEWEQLVAERQFSLDLDVEKGRPHPQWYLDEPIVHPEEHWYLAAFRDLSTERYFSDSSVGPVPWHAIVAYGREHGLGPTLMPAFHQIIRALDASYLAAQKRAMEEARKRPRDGATDPIREHVRGKGR